MRAVALLRRRLGQFRREYRRERQRVDRSVLTSGMEIPARIRIFCFSVRDCCSDCRDSCSAQSAPPGCSPPSMSGPAERHDGRRQERLDARAAGDDGPAARCGDEGPVCAGRTAPPDGQHRPADQRVAAGAAGGGVRGCRDARAGRGGDARESQGPALGARRGDGGAGLVAGADAGNDAEDCADGAGRQRGDTCRKGLRPRLWWWTTGRN